ncbi:hypothetical protein I79_016364 [Cricetulus griseus]|uniref:Uncharacterized protein n=1 Tax=Cricetulus griseus TaxID=10029 RepID=G3HZ69_CRIGR|nr:hypothetical protein I79_016364 [Cricetulus griseus]
MSARATLNTDRDGSWAGPLPAVPAVVAWTRDAHRPPYFSRETTGATVLRTTTPRNPGTFPVWGWGLAVDPPER